MRLGVSGKVFLGYAALVGVFVASSLLSLVHTERARGRILAGQVFMDTQSHVDAAWRKLSEFPGAAASRRRPDPVLPLLFVEARKEVHAALTTIDGLLHEAGARAVRLPERQELELYRDKLGLVDAKLADAQAGLGAFEASADERERERMRRDLANLTNALGRIDRAMSGSSRDVAAQLGRSGETARLVGVVLAVVGLLVAGGAALFLWMTLRPLQVLRQRARQIAGGDYGARVAVGLRDEIGDLAREFDAMAGAIQEREQRLIRSERLATVGRMAAHITHEIRNPLASIGLSAELLGDELGPDAEEARRLTTSIASEVDRLSDITETYLRFVRLPRPQREREDLSAIVRAVVEFARAELERARIAVHLDAPGGLPDVDVDEAQIRQAVLNLVRNAKEAMPDGGALRVRVAAEAGTLRILVSDSGPGVPEEAVGKIFDPFYSTKAKGTGLGLALVAQIVAEHRGRIEVTRAVPNETGACFVIALPMADAAPPDGGAVPQPTGAPEAVKGPEREASLTSSAPAPAVR